MYTGSGQRSGQTRNIIFIILIFAAATLYYILRPASPSGLSFGDEAMTIAAAGEEPYVIEVPYDGITGLEQVEDLDLGRCLVGAGTGKCLYGLWENDAFGRYRLCVWTGITAYVVLDTAEGTVVCNYESDAATGSLYDALVKFLAERDSGEAG